MSDDNDRSKPFFVAVCMNIRINYHNKLLR
jgi:hypothetical protein